MRQVLASTAAAAVLVTALAAPEAPAFAQSGGDRVNQIIVYGNDPCPRSTDDEVVVCARKPETERYRIPERYRPSGTRQQMESWANRAKAIEYVGQTGTMSCSPVGPGGYTGCLSQAISRAKAEYKDNQKSDVPPER
jgi:hypothetical protein